MAINLLGQRTARRAIISVDQKGRRQDCSLMPEHDFGPTEDLAVTTLSDTRPANWTPFARTLLLTILGLAAAILVFATVLNPYGNLPVKVFGQHVIMDINQRFQYPAVIRSQLFDSAVIGTSTSRLLEPAHLNKTFGGNFANLAMNSATAWEQYELTKLLLRHWRKPKTILFGIDTVWCETNADKRRITKRGFPEWMYDANPWNDWLYIFNGKAIEIAGRQIAYRLGFEKPRIPFDGFEIFVPPDTEYDIEKARQHIWRGPPRDIAPKVPAVEVSTNERASWEFPAIAWFDELMLSIPEGTNVIVAYMPVHAAAIPKPGTMSAAKENECKSRILTSANGRAAHVVDFRLQSDITTNDTNYWDNLHFRLPIGAVIINGISEAIRTRQADLNGRWTYNGRTREDALSSKLKGSVR